MVPTPPGSQYTDSVRDSRFRLVATDGAARAGVLQTAHGAIRTPAFMPVGTQGTVKGLTPADLVTVAAPCVLGNTYHLWLRPGHRLIAEAGGLHRFMGWDGPILTDSGGFQVLSLAHLGTVDEVGVTLRSHLDGSVRTLTPELAMEIQAALGSDIAMALDVCPPYPCASDAVGEAVARTTRWAARSLAAFRAPGQLVFGIAQGGIDVHLRREAAASVVALGFDGYAIGGLRIGEEREATWPALEAAVAELPSNRPRYMMGVGEPDDLLDGIARGVDLFDCVLPTRLGRNGTAMLATGRFDLRRADLAGRTGSLDPSCDCYACTRFSVGYLHHLVRSRDELGLRLVSLHNVRFLIHLLERARQAIEHGALAAFCTDALRSWRRSNSSAGNEHRQRSRQQRRPAPRPLAPSEGVR